MMLSKFHKNKKGFTLIELLIVVAIIGILAAIAIPQFAAYRTRAFDSSAQSDLRTIRTSLEGFFTEEYEYPDGIASDAAGSINVLLSNRVVADYGSANNAAGTTVYYVADTYHETGSKTFGASDNTGVLYVHPGLDIATPAAASDIDWSTGSWEAL